MWAMIPQIFRLTYLPSEFLMLCLGIISWGYNYKLLLSNQITWCYYKFILKLNKYYDDYSFRNLSILKFNKCRSPILHSWWEFPVIRPHKQYSLFLIPARTQYLELIVSRACGIFAESAFWKFGCLVYESWKVVSCMPDSVAVRRESGQTAYYVSCKLAKKSLAC